MAPTNRGGQISDRGRKKMGAQNQSARSIETQVETLFFACYCLNSTYSFHF